MALPVFQKPLIKALLLSPLSVVLGGAASLAIIIFAGIGRAYDWTIQGYLKAVFEVGFFGIPLAYVAVTTVGWPVHSILRRIKRTSYFYYAAAGVLAGVVVGYAFGRDRYDAMWVIGITCSWIVASTFWFFVNESQGD